MIKIFNSSDTDFSSGGNIIINPTKCIETRKKSLNGWYIDVEVPIKYNEYLDQDMLCVIKSKSKVNPQAFRIKNIERKQRKLVFQAQHVMFDSEDYFLLDVRPTAKNGQNVLSYINERTDKSSPFSVFSNVTTESTAYFIRKSMLEAWEVIEEKWGGVFDADNWNVSLLTSVGNDNGETVAYGKNMEGISVYEDWSSVVTKLYPVGYDGIMLPEVYLESDIQYDEPYTRTVDFETDLETDDQTETNLINELRAKATAYLKDNKVPKISYTVNVNINESLKMGDTVHIRHPLCDILAEVIEYEYNLISEKTKSITVGNYSRDVKTKFNTIKQSINQISEKITTQEAVIAAQTELINSLNKDGYVYIDENEVLILDRLPKEEAQNVWRFGLGGIGFSSHGYEGPFEIAITMDGQINANFITTGQMNIARIEGLTDSLNNINTAIEFNSNNIQMLVENKNQSNTRIQTLEETVNRITDIEDVTEEATGFTKIELNNCMVGNLLELHIYGNNEVFGGLYPKKGLYPQVGLYPRGSSSQLKVTDEQGNVTYYELNISTVLRSSGDYHDEFVIKDGYSYVIRRVILDNNGNTTINTAGIIEDKKEFGIDLSEGKNTIEIIDYTANMYAKWILKNDYTDLFATKVDTHSEISQTAEKIRTEVSKEITTANGELQKDISEITQITEQIQSTVSKHTGEISTLTQTSNSIQQTVSTQAGEISALNQTANSVQQTVSTHTGEISALNQTTNSIQQQVSKKVGDSEIIAKLNLAVKDKQGIIELIGNIVKIVSDYFEVTEDGKIKSTGGTIGGFTISSNALQSESAGFSSNEYYAFWTKVQGVTTYFVTWNGDISCKSILVNNYPLIRTSADSGKTIDVSYIDGNQLVAVTGNSMYIFIPDSVSSDKKLKKNIKKTKINALEIISQLSFKEFDWKKTGKHEEIGIVADEVEEISNFLVSEMEFNDEKTKVFNQGSMILVNSKAIQELHEENKNLKILIENLTSRIEKLEKGV